MALRGLTDEAMGEAGDAALPDTTKKLSTQITRAWKRQPEHRKVRALNPNRAATASKALAAQGVLSKVVSQKQARRVKAIAVSGGNAVVDGDVVLPVVVTSGRPRSKVPGAPFGGKYGRTKASCGMKANCI
ncbi:hypothetical protein COO60DRAFT_1460874 [Scenedesmus sp. NREL 46B-D3]|nr:hypothetical protein COO60DRAFT_1460874 [Scenedesmus sp. NREL 46B-D3]